MFITFEGIEGSGKSTQVKLLAEALKDKNIDPVVTREPGGTEVGDQLRQILLNHPMTMISELFIVFAARAQHLSELIEPALQENKIVICDRYSDSTLAYQGFGRGMSLDQLEKYQSLTGFRVPDITFFLDITVEESLSRVWARGQNRDRLEREKLDFHEKVRQGFLQIARSHPSRVMLLDGIENPQKIHEKIFREIEKRLS